MNENEYNLSLPFLTRRMVDFEQGAVFSIIVDLIAQSTQAIVLTGLTKAGIFTYRIVPVDVGNLETFTFGIPDIPIILSITIPPVGDPTAVNFVTAYLGINTNRIALLCQGTVSAYFGISWPNQHPPTAAQSQGEVARVTGINQAAGDEISDTVPTNQTWELLGILFTLVASSDAASRTVSIQIAQDLPLRFIRAAGTAQTASQTISYSFIPGGTTGVTVANNAQEVAIPTGIILPPEATIISATTNLQAGDNFGAPIYVVRRIYHPAVTQILI